MVEQKDRQPEELGRTRRTFFANLLMGAGLVVSYLTAGAFALRFLYPVRREQTQRLFVGLRSRILPGRSVPFRTPQGQTINIVHGQKGFIALSDVCPHLGCRVHWNGPANEFVCPCHDGHFDAEGRPISGPPADMNAPLTKFDVVLEDDIVYLDLPVQA